MEKQTYDIMSNFMQLLETIANAKTRQLDFGGDMILYRGEIHMIKVIGDQPGMFISEIARCFRVTRAVISKIVLKLERNGYVRKVTDPADRKRVQVYLTERGQIAFEAHNNFHFFNDRQIYTYLEALSEKEREAVSGFLREARHMIEHHF